MTRLWDAGIALFIAYRNRSLDKRLLSFGAPHVFRSNWLWDLPVGPNRKFAGGTRGFVGRLLEHWQIGAIHNRFSGIPISWDSGRSSLNNFSGDNTANFTGPVSAHIGKIEKRGNGVFFYGDYSVRPDPQVSNVTALNGVQGRSTLQAVADKSGNVVAVNPLPGTLGSSPTRYFYGPGYYSLDMNLLKNITIRERVQVQIGVTADNVLNRIFFTDPDNNLSKNINNTNFGQFTTTDYGARLVILNLRINF